MEPKNFRFGGGLAETMLHPVVLVAMLITIALMLLLPRKYAAVPLLFLVFLTPHGQQVVVGGVHVFVFRIVILFTWIRVCGTKLSSSAKTITGQWTSVDTAFTCWAIVRVFACILLYWQAGAAINQVGFLLDAFGGYFLLRYLIQDEEDILRVVKALAAITAILALCILNEKFRGQNIFGYLGGVSIVPELRDGAIRPQGPFGHPLLAGTFAATLLPLFVWLWISGRAKALGLVGLISSTIVTMASASSTPLLAYAAAIMGICFWPIRKKMRSIRWGLVIGLITLHLIMKAPVWFIITHIDLIGASSGYHRAFLVDQFIRHFWDWWLVGTKDNANWGWDMFDLSNQYVAEGVTGGLLGLVFFIAMISRGFGRLGDARKVVDGDSRQEWLIWLLGSSLFAHCVGFFGVSYWDQTQVAWFALFAMICTVTTAAVVQPAKESETALAGFPLRYAPRAPAAVAKPWLQPSRKEPTARPMKWLGESVAGQRKP
jgi:hypothetical protein